MTPDRVNPNTIKQLGDSMAETTAPTEEVVEQSAGVEQSTLPAENTNESAVENVDDNGTEQTSSDQSTTTSSNEDKVEVDEKLAKFAKSQGFDPENLSPDVAKALKIARDNQVALRSQDNGAVEEIVSSAKPDEGLSDRAYVDFKFQQSEMLNNLTKYWGEHPEDKEFEGEAVAILNKEKEQYGDDAMWRLAGNMDRLMREAKFAAGAFDTTKAIQQGRVEERERINKLTEGSGDTTHARAATAGEQQESMEDFIKSGKYDPSDPEQRARVDAYLKGVMGR